MGEMQFSILNSHYQQHKWAGPIYSSYHSSSSASSSSHPSYIPWEPYPLNPETNSFGEKRYNTLESVLLGEIPASYSHLTTTSPHQSSSSSSSASPSTVSSCSSSSSSSSSSASSPSTPSDCYSASPRPPQSPAPILLQKEIIRPAASGLSEYQSEPMDLSCKTPGASKGGINDNIAYVDERSFLEPAVSYSYAPPHDGGVTDCSLMSPHMGAQTYLSPEPQQRSSPIQHSSEQHSHLLLTRRPSPTQLRQCDSPMHQQHLPSHQEPPLHYQLSPEHRQTTELVNPSRYACVTPTEFSVQPLESCNSSMQLCPESSPSSRLSVSPSSSSTFLLNQTSASSSSSSSSSYSPSSSLEHPQPLYEVLQSKPPHHSEQSTPSSTDPPSFESNRPVQTPPSVTSQSPKTAGHSLLRDLLSCGRNNKLQETNGRLMSLTSENSFSSSSKNQDDNDSSCPPKPKEEYIGSKDYSLCSTTRVTLAKKNLLPISARVTEWLYKMVRFAKEIPQFVKLPNNDRLTLVLNSWTRLLLMHMAENNFQFAVTPLPSSQETKTDEAPASDEPTMKSVESVQSFIRKCQCMNLDTSEFEYLRMLVLFNAGYVGLEKSSVVDNMNSCIQQHLQQHIHTKHPRDHIRFSRVLMCLPSLYGINCKMIDNLFCSFIHGKTDIEVLLKDMLQDL